MSDKLLAVFLKIRNGILRNDLYNCLLNIQEYADEIFVCDDGSYDGTTQVLESLIPEENILKIPIEEHNFAKELFHKEELLKLIHKKGPFSFILWMDSDEILDAKGTQEIRQFCRNNLTTSTQGWAFHYTQCLHRKSVVYTEYGPKTISEIVQNRLKCKVLSISPSGIFEYKDITSWYVSKKGNRKFLKVYFTDSIKDSLHRKYGVTVTEDHEFLTHRGYVQAKHLKISDLVCSIKYYPKKRQYDNVVYKTVIVENSDYNYTEFENSLVYCIDVEDNHNFVTPGGVVHNCWRNTEYARTDDGFDDGWFIKLWRYRSDLTFEVEEGTHKIQFPKQIIEAYRQQKILPAPYEILHYGNVGQNLKFKCLYSESIVRTEDGSKTIRWIVNNRWSGKVLSVSEDGNIDWKNIVGWYKSKREDRKLIKIRFENNTNGVIVSDDHKFLTKNGWIECKNLTKDDEVFTGTPFSEDERFNQMIYGSMLGDAHITPTYGFRETHCLAQEEYLSLKNKLFSNFNTNLIYYDSECNNVKFPSLYLSVSAIDYFRYLREIWYVNNIKLHPKNIVDKLDDFGLAIWYMDDGSLIRKNGKCTYFSNDERKWSKGREQPFYYFTLTIGNITEDELMNILECFKKKNLHFNFQKNHESDTVFRLTSSSEKESKQFFDSIYRYVPKSMRYKLPPEYIDLEFDESVYSPVSVKSFYRKITKEDVTNELDEKRKNVLYCIDVEDNHSFVTPGGVVHNSIQYRNGLGGVDRHLRFNNKSTYRKIPQEIIPYNALVIPGDVPKPFTSEQIRLTDMLHDFKKLQKHFCVIIPTYNRHTTLPRAFDSLIAQTYEKWHCVVLDDGSSDSETEKVVMEYCEKDPRFFYAKYLEHRGGVAVNENGMEIAVQTADWWVRLGSDDWFFPNKLELDAKAFNEGHMALYSVFTVHRDGVFGESGNYPIPSDKIKEGFAKGGFYASWASVAVSTQVLEQVKEKYGNYVDPRLINMEDRLFNYRVSTLCDWTFVGRTKEGEFIIDPSESVMKDIMDKKLIIEPEGVWNVNMIGASANTEIYTKDSDMTTRIIAHEEFKYEQK